MRRGRRRRAVRPPRGWNAPHGCLFISSFCTHTRRFSRMVLSSLSGDPRGWCLADYAWPPQVYPWPLVNPRIYLRWLPVDPRYTVASGKPTISENVGSREATLCGFFDGSHRLDIGHCHRRESPAVCAEEP
jgi:hypothetical protein